MTRLYWVFAVINLHDGTRTILTETIEAQIVQKLKNNEPRPKFTGSYKKNKSVYHRGQSFLLY